MGKFLYMTEKDFIDKTKIGTAAAKEVIKAEKTVQETDSQREQRLKEAEATKYEQELRQYFAKLTRETQEMIVKTAEESIREKESMKVTHSYLWEMLRKQAIKKTTEEYRVNKFL